MLLTILNVFFKLSLAKWDSQEPGDVKNKFQVIWDDNVASKQK